MDSLKSGMKTSDSKHKHGGAITLYSQESTLGWNALLELKLVQSEDKIKWSGYKFLSLFALFIFIKGATKKCSAQFMLTWEQWSEEAVIQPVSGPGCPTKAQSQIPSLMITVLSVETKPLLISWWCIQQQAGFVLVWLSIDLMIWKSNCYNEGNEKEDS